MIAILVAILLLSVSAHGQRKAPVIDEPKVYSINQSAISHSRPVSFSMAYPKDWQVSEGGRRQVGEFLIDDDPLVCSSSPIPAVPMEFSTKIERNADITIWRAAAATPEEEVEAVARQQPATYKRKLSSSIVTKAGDRGYLLVSEANFGRGPELFSDLFFHHGDKGAIRISIRTKAEDSKLFQHLQNLVLQTLRFSDN